MIKTKTILIIGFIASFVCGGANLTKAATAPSFIYLTWESDAVAPAAYNGKSLLVRDSLLKLTVRPFVLSAGSYLNPGTLNYRWSINDKVKKEGEGIMTFRFLVPSVLDDFTQTVKVEVFRGLTLLGEKTVVIPVIDPKVILRPIDNSLRVKNGVLEVTNSGDVQIQANPYFFSPTTQNQFKASWWLNDEKQKSDSDSQYLLTVSKTQNAANKVAALIERLDNVFVRGSGQLQIKFIGI